MSFAGLRAVAWLSTEWCRRGNLSLVASPIGAADMSKPTKTEAQLIAMAQEELKAHLDCPDGIVISVLRAGDTWEFRTTANETTIAKPGYPECVAMIVQIGDHLSKQYDLLG
jgi:hypothetical protein